MSTVELPSPSLPQPAESRAPRRSFFDDMPDRGLFALVAVAGFVAILTSKSAGFNSDIITIGAALLMLVYGIAAYQFPNIQLRPDRLGDNFYYLGFIFTLASLTAAILQLRSGADIDQLLASFGIALVTTILGVAGRVVFVQLRTDIDEIEEDVRRDLARTAADLRAELFSSVREFEMVRTALVQGLQEQSAAFAKASEQRAEEISRVAAAAGKSVEAALQASQNSVTQFQEQLSKISNLAEQAASKMNEIQFPNDRLSRQLADFATKLEALLQRLGSSVEDTARRASLPNERLNGTLDEFTRELQVQLQKLAQAVDTASAHTKRSRWMFWRR